MIRTRNAMIIRPYKTTERPMCFFYNLAVERFIITKGFRYPSSTTCFFQKMGLYAYVKNVSLIKRDILRVWHSFADRKPSIVNH